jgi:hypothetical protein
MGVPGGGRRGRQPHQFVGQTKPVGQYSLTVWQYWLTIKINGTNLSILWEILSILWEICYLIGIFRNHFSPPPRQKFWKVSPENFFWQLGNNPKKSGKFLSARPIFSFPYAYGIKHPIEFSNPILKPELRFINEIYKSIKFMTSLIVSCLSSVRL